MASITSFEQIEAWKGSRELVNKVYEITRPQPFSNDWGLKDQIQRAAVSIMANIAEGYERGSNKEFIQFLFIARGSAGEVRSLLYVAYDQKYILEPVLNDMLSSLTSISKQIRGFISYLQSSQIKKC
jgi:four helix bundle protein